MMIKRQLRTALGKCAVIYLDESCDCQLGIDARHTAKHCNTLQHTVTHCSTGAFQYMMCLSIRKYRHSIALWHCYTLQHTTLQHTAPHCCTIAHICILTYAQLWLPVGEWGVMHCNASPRWNTLAHRCILTYVVTAFWVMTHNIIRAQVYE